VASDQSVGDLLHELVPRVLGTLVRRHGQFDACEDAVQKALLAAARRWPDDGVPERPHAWLLTVATRTLVDFCRRDSARRRRELEAVALESAGVAEAADVDDALALLFLCCHPDLSPSSQLALALRAVGGLTTAEIAAAFLNARQLRTWGARRSVAGREPAGRSSGHGRPSGIIARSWSAGRMRRASPIPRA
jgi:predicted RNA polymerase sigma factor